MSSYKDDLIAGAWQAKTASNALDKLTRYNPRVGVWCAAAVAESGLDLYYPSDAEERPGETAVFVARRWAIGKPTRTSPKAASDAAFGSSEDLYGSALAEDYRGDKRSRYTYYLNASTAVYVAACAALAADRGTSDPVKAAYNARTTADRLSETYATTYEKKNVVDEEAFERAKQEEDARLLKVVVKAIGAFPDHMLPSGALSRGSMVAGAVGLLLGAGAMYASKRA